MQTRHHRGVRTEVRLAPADADRPAGAALDVAACCAPLAREPLSAATAAELAGVLKALADPVRLRLLSLIQSHADGEACVCDLTEPFSLTQPTVSHHLKVLLDAGLVEREKRGVWAYYRVVPAALAALSELIDSPAAP